tara:strand:+ start:1216 stop:1470 length:255 start_codon:yes stop_codon:yes gene_type:complete
MNYLKIKKLYKIIFGSLYPSIISPIKFSLVEYLSSISNEGIESSRFIKPSLTGLFLQVRKAKKRENTIFSFTVLLSSKNNLCKE